MSYQVLARKYRPRSFHEVIGQGHVLNTIVNSLDQEKLHHAYLFSGSQGIGKTSIARLLAKSVNCLSGISSNPCQKCVNCVGLVNGNFVDLMEIDGASRTKIEDTREILDDIQYMPVQGKFKVYLIDEVHMLSNHSFNALLKTLEEPPEHVKFLLATTEPAKIPVTILSRCIKFHLKRLTNKQVNQKLTIILAKEEIPFENSAVQLISDFTKGSIRDALNLADQAIAFGHGKLSSKNIRTMLGIVDVEIIDTFINCILSKKANEIIMLCRKISLMDVSPDKILDAIARSFYYASVYQLTKTCDIQTGFCSGDMTKKLAKSLSTDMLQTYYKLVIRAKKDISLAPSNDVALGMSLLGLSVHNEVTSKMNISEDHSKRSNNFNQSALESRLSDPHIEISPLSKDNWHEMIKMLDLKGTILQVALNSELVSNGNGNYTLISDKNITTLITNKTKIHLKLALQKYLKSEVKIKFAQGKPYDQGDNKINSVSPQSFDLKQEHQRKLQEIKQNPNIQRLQDMGFELDIESVK